MCSPIASPDRSWFVLIILTSSLTSFLVVRSNTNSQPSSFYLVFKTFYKFRYIIWYIRPQNNKAWFRQTQSLSVLKINHHLFSSLESINVLWSSFVEAVGLVILLSVSLDPSVRMRARNVCRTHNPSDPAALTLKEQSNNSVRINNLAID